MVITIRTANQTSNSNVQIKKKRYLICDYQLLGNKKEIFNLAYEIFRFLLYYMDIFVILLIIWIFQ